MSSGKQIFELASGIPISPTDVVPMTHLTSGDAVKVQLFDIVAYGLTSGVIQSGHLGFGSVTSGNIASGLLGGGATLTSGIITSGYIGNDAVNSGNVASGQIGQYHLASGVMFQLTSGIITSGYIGNNAVVSGSIASGSIEQNHIATGFELPKENTTRTSIGLGNKAYVSGGFSNFIGTSAGENVIAYGNNFIGYAAGSAVDSPVAKRYNNVLGNYAAANNGYGSIAIGDNAQWKSGEYQIAIGKDVDQSTESYFSGHDHRNIQIGSWSLSGTKTIIYGQTNFPEGINITNLSGQLQASIGSGGLIYGSLSSGMVVSGNVASGQIGLYHLASGVIASGLAAVSLYSIGRNATGDIMSGLSAVYISGSFGNRPSLGLGLAITDAYSAGIFGLVQTNIANNSDGVVVTQGQLENVDTSMYSAGDKLWLSATVSGGLTNVRPIPPNHTVFIGNVIRSHPNLGIIEVSIQNGYELSDELHNVASGTPTSGQILQYSSGLWWNQNPPAATIGSGSVQSGDIASGAVYQVSAINLDNSQNYRLLFQKDDGTVAYNSGFMYNPSEGTLFLGSGGIIISDVPNNNTIIAARSITNPTVPSGQVCVVVGDSILENNNAMTGVTALGYAIGSNDGDQAYASVAIGWQAFNNILGSTNTGCGYRVAAQCASGSYNVAAFGASALAFAKGQLQTVTAIGPSAGASVTTGATACNYIGGGANTGVASGQSPVWEMAFAGTGSGNYKINMGDAAHDRFWTNGVIETPRGLEVVVSGGTVNAYINSGGEIYGTSIASGVVRSGAIASGQIGINHLASGTIAANPIATTSGEYYLMMVKNQSGIQQAYTYSNLMQFVSSGTLLINQSFLNNLNGEVQNQNFGYQNAPSLRSGAFQAAVQTFGFQCFLGANGFNQSQGFGSLLFPTLSSGTNIQAFGYNLGLQATNLRDSSVIGANSLAQLLSGQDLVIVGTDSANNASGGANLQTLRHAVLIGNNITTATTDENNVVVIGQSGRSQGSNTTVIGNAQTTSGTIFGNIGFPNGLNVGSGLARITASGWFEGLVGSGAVGSGSLASGFTMFSITASGGTSYIATNDPYKASGSQTSVLIGDDVIASGNGFVNRSVIIGFEAAKRIASGTTQTTAVGRGALFGQTTTPIFSSVTSIGAESMGLATSGATNATCVGVTAGQYAAGQNLTYIGVGAGKGSANNAASINNVAVGYNAHTAVTTGADCVIVGVNAGLSLTSASRTTAIGRDALAFTTTFSDNSALGYRAGAYEAINSGTMTSRDNVTCLGNGAAVNASNQVQLGNQLTQTYVFGTVQNRSDVRDKTDIRPISHGLDFIEKIQPKEFRWNHRESYWDFIENEDGTVDRIFNQEAYENAARKRNRFHGGVIAQELKQVMDELGFDFTGYNDQTIAGGGPVLSVGYDAFIPYMIKAIQELSARVKALEGNQ